MEDWSRWLLITLLGLAFCYFLWTRIPILLGRRQKMALAFGCAYLVWLGIQILPLPPAALARLSPGSNRLYRIAAPGYGETDPRGYAYPDPGALAGGTESDPVRWLTPQFRTWRPMSLYRYGTYRVICQTAALMAFLIMALSLFREPHHQRWLALALVTAGASEAMYGAVETLTGHQHIFWYVKLHYTDAATGTLVNRNHYAAMLNMALPLAVALLLESRPPTFTPMDLLSIKAKLRQILVQSAEPLLLIASLLMGIAILLSRSRMGIAAMLAGLLILSLLLAWRGGRLGTSRARWAAILPLLLLAGIALYSLGTDVNPTAERFFRISRELETGAVRPALWSEALPVIRLFLFTGAGAGAYTHALNPNLKTLALNDFWDYDHAHNDYLEAAATLGLVGLLLGGAAFLILYLRRPGSLSCLAAQAGLLTLALHSLTDFLLVVPSNALMAVALLCLIAGGDEGPSLREATIREPARGRLIVAVSAIALIGVALWPARSLVAAAIYRPYWHESPDEPDTMRALKISSALEPENGSYSRELGKGILRDVKRRQIQGVELGGDLERQVRTQRIAFLRQFAQGQQRLLASLDVSPVDHGLHAEIAQTASDIRDLARQIGMEIPAREAPGAYASPHLASAALAPTAYGNHAVMGALLWHERADLGGSTASTALDLLVRAFQRQGPRQTWIGYLLGITEDAPSLARIDDALQPRPGAYSRLLGQDSRWASQDLLLCARTLKALAELREAAGSIRTLSGQGREAFEPLRALTLKLNSVKEEAAKLAQRLQHERGPCGDGQPRLAELVREADRLLGDLR